MGVLGYRHQGMPGHKPLHMAQGRGRAVTAPPFYVWEGLAQFAPEATELACQAADFASAAQYFAVSVHCPTLLRW